jgi:hypothetical protein
MIVPRVFKSRQRKRKNISIVLSSQKDLRFKPEALFVLVSFSEATTPSFAGESKKDYIMKRPSGIMKVRSANCTRKTPGGLLRWKKI